MKIREIQPTIIVAPAFKRVAAYARVSVEKQASLDSLSHQVSYYNEYIGNHPGWLFAGVYADYGLSGTKDNRPEFQKMLNEAKAGKIDIIITKSITRFARNTVTLLRTVRDLKELGVEVIFEKEEMSSFSPDGDLMLSLIAMFAEEEARSASENKRWQIQKQFEEGIPTYCRVFGYKWVNKRFEIIPEEAELVRMIYDMYLSGMGRTAIAKTLNEANLTLWGAPWRPATIYKLLRNEKYIGNMVLQKTHQPDFRTKKKYVNKGQWKRYLVEDSHEAIVDKRVFDMVQAEIAKRQHKSTASTGAKRGSLFCGLLMCGICKRNYRYKNKREKSIDSCIPTWMCATYLDFGKKYCSAKQIRESILISLTKQVLGLDEDADLDRNLVLATIDHIDSEPDNRLRFFLKDGRVETVEWQNPSRSKSWTPEMRETARQRSLEQRRKQKEKGISKWQK